MTESIKSQVNLLYLRARIIFIPISVKIKELKFHNCIDTATIE
jgi:hypothetical protein